MTILRQLEFGQILKAALPQIEALLVGVKLVPVLYVISGSVLFVGLVYFVRRLISLRKELKEESVLLELTPPAFMEKSAYTTSQLFKNIHDLGNKRGFSDKLLGKKVLFGLEIVSTANQGIKFFIRTSTREVNNIKRSLISYLPQVVIKEVDDYLVESIYKGDTSLSTKVVEYRLAKHFAFPLQKQDTLEEHDPIAYITGMMTKLHEGELVSFQIALSPTKPSEVKRLARMILHNENLLEYLNRFQSPIVLKPFEFLFSLTIKLLAIVARETQWMITELAHPSSVSPAFAYQLQTQQQLSVAQIKPARVLSSFEQQTVETIQEKIKQPLFESSVRVLAVMKDEYALQERIDGFTSSLSVFSTLDYQELKAANAFSGQLLNQVKLLKFKHKLLSLFSNTSSSLLSISEVADLFHFPFTSTTETEDMVKQHSKALPAPLSLKNIKDLDVVFGKNTYANSNTKIGLTDDDRSRHAYLIGQTGSGKSTVMFHMASDDINKGRGVAVIDPHGDLADDLLANTPESRMDDLIYFNPFDIKHPIRINLLELPETLDEDELELEKEFVCESVISIFRRVFSKDENADAHRIEYILRNTIYTAFTVKDCTIFTVFTLLDDPDFLKEVIAKLTDENLIKFWKNEFGRAGDYQIVKMASGVTARVGRLLFSPIAKRIFEKPKSTINFDSILDQGKVLICNFSEGKLGEDTSKLLGTTVIAKIQLAAMRRARMKAVERKPFYLFVDEFQNFATSSFTKLLSGGRKFGLRITIAEQSTAQQSDRNVVNVILANTGTVICFRTASPVDEELMEAQFAPYITAGDIGNLPRFHFYIKQSAVSPEEPYSGETLPMNFVINEAKINRLIEASRRNYAETYQKKEAIPVKLKKQRDAEENSVQTSVNSLT